MSRYACLHCQLSFGAGERCPQCGEGLSYMGWAFKAPRRGDTKQWEKVALLIRAGFRFNGDADSPPIKTLADAKTFIESSRVERLKRRVDLADVTKREKLRVKRRRLYKRKLARRARARLASQPSG